ncbi:hypothetical protein CTA2_2614 [Colletotrichum tanaceti]|uniref:Uncharacterized protein n=1 Tax=Colletotrichum tanaceti TaxID=1306861 RepID=A0A4U6X0B7_9PEZI|nr:hypothetical protein CTA2_2614 [Colletotrichum tanaceti]TKW48169.1 hypothetical protein CTA1_11692 [Colletotrichum tanaceti]
MFDHFTIGTQARSAVDGNSEEPHLSPRQCPQEIHRSTEAVAKSFSASSLFYRKTSVPPQPIDSLAHELSRQTLIPKLRQPNIATMATAIGASTSAIAELSMAALEVDEDCNMDLAIDDSKEHQPVADWKRARRQRYGRFANDPVNARAIEARVKDMISDESQCNIRLALSLPSLSSKVPTYPYSPSPHIESGGPPSVESSTNGLEVDEGFCDDDEELAFMQRALAVDKDKLIGMSGALRKFGPLRFRGSVETALRCQNVVRQRPRMRRRKGPGPSQEPRRTRANEA